MSHIANHRIKKDGKYYAPGEPIELTEDDLAELPEGAAREADPEDAAANETTDVARNVADVVSNEAEVFAKVRTAVLELPATAFKKDGEIRADALKALNEKLGLQLTAENVSVAKNATE